MGFSIYDIDDVIQGRLKSNRPADAPPVTLHDLLNAPCILDQIFVPVEVEDDHDSSDSKGDYP